MMWREWANEENMGLRITVPLISYYFTFQWLIQVELRLSISISIALVAMALKFLNKKGWHTGSLRNIENVWKAEQKHDAEQKKLEELRKQIVEERERSEFRLLQEQAGLVPYVSHSPNYPQTFLSFVFLHSGS